MILSQLIPVISPKFLLVDYLSQDGSFIEVSAINGSYFIDHDLKPIEKYMNCGVISIYPIFYQATVWNVVAINTN